MLFVVVGVYFASSGFRRKMLQNNGVPRMTKAAVSPSARTEKRAALFSAPVLPPTSGSGTTFRFSGHQTFPLRIAWIPKAAGEIVRGSDPLTNIDEGITKLGLGKNMVEALRCWIEAFQIASRVDGRWSLTRIGELIFHPKNGLDPYLEDISSSWILHWLICTNIDAPFFAWECVFNRWPATDFSASQILDAFEKETARAARPASVVTLRQHWEVFLHSYL
ncbi:MAG: DUF4007 family protein, partial [Verrucomicrobiota bacterium]|nr:DUF4007 family protein [Verrucomicrobiota bacterium]